MPDFIQDPILVFTIIALVMLMAPLLADRFRIPDLVVLLVAGMLLGPNGLGLLERNAAVTLFGSVGLLYIMFLAGLEIDLHRFAQTKHKSLSFGLLTFAVPQTLGTLAGHFILGFSWSASLLLASMFASHTLLSYPLASRLGIARTEPVSITVGATILTDTLALLVLAVVADSTKGVALSPGFWIGILIGMVALVALTWYGIPRLTRWFLEHVTEAGGAQFLFVLVVVCGCSYLSHYAKLEPIIGAFLAGAAFNRLVPAQSVLMNRIEFAGNTLFIPFFLISVGMLVDPLGLVASPRAWLVVVVMVVGVIVTKYLAAWIAARLCGYDSDARNVMFGLSVVQAAATLAAVLVGYELKIFDETVLNGAIAMIMVTCPLGSWVVDRYGRRMAARGLPREQPPPAATREQRILVPVANPEFATRLMDLAFLLNKPDATTTIHPLTIAHDDANIDEAVSMGEKLLAHCLSRAAAVEMPVHPSIRVDVNISDGIARAARELHSSLTLVGWEGTPTASARLFGGVMRRLLISAPSRLMFCRITGQLGTTSRLLVLLDPLAESRADLSDLIADSAQLARQLEAELRVYFSSKPSDACAKMVQQADRERPATVILSDTLSQAVSTLQSHLRDHDMILLAAQRREDALWSPTLERLPESLAARHPEANLIVAYPARRDYQDSDDAFTRAPPSTGNTFDLYPVDCHPDATLPVAIGEIARAAFPENPHQRNRAARMLTTSAAAFPVELAPGAVLLHMHSDAINRPVLVIGHGNFPMPGGDTQARILLALMSPAEQSTERHLRSLAELARRFNETTFVEAVSQARSAVELCRLFQS